MTRFVALVALLSVAPVAVAQPDPTPVKKLTVTPAAEPRPARKYELLPGMRERQPGNAALAYHRAFDARPAAPPDRKAAGDAEKMLEQWFARPLDQLPADEVRTFLAAYHPMLREAETGARRETCDWEMTDRLRAEGISVILNEVQPSREVARYLSLRVRLELAGDRYDAAARSLRTGFQMSRHVGEAPTLIQMLVGHALAAIYLERVEEWIARPGSPNLYWGLTGLPDPLIDPMTPFEGEALVFDQTFPGFERLNAGPLTSDEAFRVASDAFTTIHKLGPAGPGEGPDAGLAKVVGGFGLAGYVAFNHDAAKKELVARGRSPKEVDAMAPAQAVVLNSLERFREVRDEQWKWVGMPYHVALPGMKAAADRLKAVRKEYPNDIFLAMFSLVLPATEKALFATARVARKVAALRAIEAVRMYAAAHGGKPPARLADVTAVPVPADPVTGQPFGYASRADGFSLTAPPPPGEAPNPSNTLSYDVTIRAK